MQYTAENLVMLSEVARILRVAEATVRSYDRKGILPASRLSNGSRVWERKAVQALNERRQEGHRE